MKSQTTLKMIIDLDFIYDLYLIRWAAMIDDYTNTVIISSKPIMNYVVASITLFNQGVEKIIIRARGRHISKAVDVTELLKNVFFKGVIIEEILLDTDVLHREDGKKVNISSIQIHLVTKV